MPLNATILMRRNTVISIVGFTELNLKVVINGIGVTRLKSGLAAIQLKCPLELSDLEVAGSSKPYSRCWL